MASRADARRKTCFMVEFLQRERVVGLSTKLLFGYPAALGSLPVNRMSVFSERNGSACDGSSCRSTAFTAKTLRAEFFRQALCQLDRAAREALKLLTQLPSRLSNVRQKYALF